MRSLFLALAWSAAVTGTAARSPSDPCTGPAEFAGEVITGILPGTVKLEWTMWEDGSVRQYRLGRHPLDCDTPRCMTRLGKLNSTEVANALKTYAFIDTAPPGTWIYKLEVRRAPGGACALETTVVVPSFPPCDTAALCAQVGASFAGDVILGSAAGHEVMLLKWLTHAETEALQGYRLSRFNCRVPRDCSTEIATLNATGTCGQVMLHSVTDTPPEGALTYVLDVLDSGGRTACSLRLPAPASPASSR